jgi:hypothetical protein
MCAVSIVQSPLLHCSANPPAADWLGVEGVEPSRRCRQGILSPQRMPFRHTPACSPNSSPNCSIVEDAGVGYSIILYVGLCGWNQ